MSRVGLGPDRLMDILTSSLAAAIDRDVERLAEATKPLFIEGDSADQYGFLLGLLHIVKAKAFPKLDDDEFVALQIGNYADGPDIAYGRLLAAYANDDTESCLALWAVANRDDRTAAHVLSTGIAHAAAALRKAGDR